MSRSGYSDSLDNWSLIRWRGAVSAGLRGKRGQKLLTDLAAAMDAMPEKRLASSRMVAEDGCRCALGAVALHRGIDTTELEFSEEDYDDDFGDDKRDQIAGTFDVAKAVASEVMFMNDDGWYSETPEQRWTRMRAWVAEQIQQAKVHP